MICWATKNHVNKAYIISASTITIERVPLAHYPLISRFYNRARYKSKPAKVDEVWGVKVDGEWIAALRLCPLLLTESAPAPADGFLSVADDKTTGLVSVRTDDCFLRSLAVLPERRREGIGHQLMHEVCLTLDKPCWCFPYLHLQGFYERLGFQSVEMNEVPDLLWRRFEVYERQGKSLLVMQRPVVLS